LASFEYAVYCASLCLSVHSSVQGIKKEAQRSSKPGLPLAKSYFQMEPFFDADLLFI